MHDLLEALRPILRALVATACGVMLFAVLRWQGFAAETSLLGGLILAGGLNIHGLV